MAESVTSQKLRGGEGLELFAYLKITGLPYYFFCAIDPTDARHGASAWTLPTGFSSVKGMMLPQDRLEQSLGDIIGGIARPERLRLSLLDFQASDSRGTYEYLSRIFSPGRILAEAIPAELETSIASGDGAAATFNVQQCQTQFADDALVYIGGETLQVDTATAPAGVAKRSTVTIAARNLYPCAGALFPPTPFHRVDLTDVGLGIPGRNPLVTTEPITLVGRSAAYYVGYMRPDNTPCPEGECMLRFLGTITGMDYGQDGGQYEIEMESITGQLEDAVIAPGLAAAGIPDQIVLSSPEWRTMDMQLEMADPNTAIGVSYGSLRVTIDNGGTNVYSSAQELCNAINKSLADKHLAHFDFQGNRKPMMISVAIEDKDGRQYFKIITSLLTGGTKWTLFNGQGQTETNIRSQKIGMSVGLMTVMGFDWETTSDASAEVYIPGDNTHEFRHEIIASRPVPRVFIPFSPIDTSTFFIRGPDAYPVNRFFTDQGDGSGQAWVRFGNGSIVRCLDATNPLTTAGNMTSAVQRATITTKSPPSYKLLAVGIRENYRFGGEDGQFYYVPSDADPATVEQVVLQPGSLTDADIPAGRFIGRLLSGRPQFGAQDNPTAKFTDGIGLGWYDILDTSSFRRSEPADLRRMAIIDRGTKMGELLEPMCREYGWIVLWDPALSRIAIRRIRVPSAALGAQPIFSESNRASITDRTRQVIDQTNIRTSWSIKYGWNRVTQKFEREANWHDVWGRSTYGASVKTEKIEDKTIPPNNTADTDGLFTALILQRDYFYRFPWLRCKRTLNRVGLALAPGSYHQVIDATLINPFTGRRGVTAADRLYCMVLATSAHPLGGECEVEFLVNRQDPGAQFRPWSPCALVDFDAASHGYNSATGVLTLKSYFASDGVSYDGIDFRVGDLVTLVSRDNPELTPVYIVNATVSAVAANGQTITVDAGLTALPSDSDVLVVLRTWQTPQTAARKTEGDAVAFLGNPTGVISTTTDRNHRWL